MASTPVCSRCAASLRAFSIKPSAAITTAVPERQTHRGAMGKAANDVLAPQLERIHPELAGRDVDAAFDQVVGLGLSGAAIGVDRRGVGEDAPGLERNQRNVVNAAHGTAH